MAYFCAQGPLINNTPSIVPLYRLDTTACSSSVVAVSTLLDFSLAKTS